MIPLFLGFIGAVAVAEVYKRYVTPEQKRQWQNFTKMHHGEAGALMTIVGIATKSPTLIGSGIGLLVHDNNDSNKWFRR